jgi:hypothetical protein
MLLAHCVYNSLLSLSLVALGLPCTMASKSSGQVMFYTFLTAGLGCFALTAFVALRYCTRHKVWGTGGRETGENAREDSSEWARWNDWRECPQILGITAFCAGVVFMAGAVIAAVMPG